MKRLRGCKFEQEDRNGEVGLSRMNPICDDVSNEAVSRLLGHASDRVRAHRDQGLSFNIFDILNVARKEVRCHSAFIAALLDPARTQGLHGQGDLFLQLFFIALNEVEPRLAGRLPSLKGGWHVYVERICRHEDGSNDGRIDILLEQGPDWVVIENKIDAGDQEGQLYRYATQAARLGKKCVLVYLTLNGDPPTESSLKGIPADRVVCISYRDTIAHWLDSCVASVLMKPALYETIRQYGRLVRRFSDTGLFPDLTMEILNLLRSSDNLEAAAEIALALPKARAQVQVDFWSDLRVALVALNDLPEDLIKDFSPTLKAVEKNPGGDRKFGYCFSITDKLAMRRLVLMVRPNESLYFVFACVENGGQVPLTPAEQIDIRRACEANCTQYELHDGDGGTVWVKPHHPLNFKEFGSREAALADSDLRKEVAKIVADEVAFLGSSVRSGLRNLPRPSEDRHAAT